MRGPFGVTWLRRERKHRTRLCTRTRLSFSSRPGRVSWERDEDRNPHLSTLSRWRALCFHRFRTASGRPRCSDEVHRGRCGRSGRTRLLLELPCFPPTATSFRGRAAFIRRPQSYSPRRERLGAETTGSYSTRNYSMPKIFCQ